MIIFVTTRSHRYTHRHVGPALPMFRQMSYPALLARRSLPRATYIFSDFDRLSFWQLELAAHVCRTLRAAGLRVLNDPARGLQRLALLRQLFREGINSFQAWAATDLPAVDRFPVFIRTASAHRGNLTEMLYDHPSLSLALEGLVQDGYPLADLIVVEYRAEPINDNVFRKLAVYRIGDRLVPAPSVHERHWTAKYGEDGVAGEAAYAADLATMRNLPHADIFDRAFMAANIDYGRADYGIVAGRPEIYEINTNPTIGRPVQEHPFVDRIAADRVSHQGYEDALKVVDDATEGGAVHIPCAVPLKEKARRFRLFPGYQWVP